MHRPLKRRSRRQSIAVVCLLALAAVVAGCGGGHRAAPAAPPAPTAASGPGFHTSGNEIIGPTGQQFVPYGFVLFCLAEKNLSCEQPSAQNPNTDTAKIEASAKFWHANTVRLQVAQENLFSQSPDNSSYLNSIDSEVHLANSLGMVAIVSLQVEQFSGPPMPTAPAVRFWTFMAEHFRNSPGVFFDLFNEPRLGALQGKDWLWNIWRNGGSVNTGGINETFVGMQTLVDTVRRTGVQNVIVAEGLGSDHDLSLLPSHFLVGQNIAYGMDPDIKPNTETPAQWEAAYGKLSNQVPLVMDEFHDYPTAGPCYPQSPKVLPQLFSYLRSKHLGLLVWTLAPGIVIVDSDLQRPTSYQGASTQLCVAHSKSHTATNAANYDPNTNTNGPGADILAFFSANSQTFPPAVLLATA